MTSEKHRELDMTELKSVSGGGEHEMYMAAIKHLACWNATDSAPTGRAPQEPSLGIGALLKR